MKSFLLYIHFPYCVRKCPYCDFNSYACDEIPENEYVEALISELKFRSGQGEWRRRTVETVYFGGGTPSLLSIRGIKKIIQGICEFFPLDPKVEITLELNPGSLQPDYFIGIKASGINRISIGVQSLNDHFLKFLGRIHSAVDAVDGVNSARKAGFDNISTDLIYAFPGQTMADLKKDVEGFVSLAPEHISAYTLTIEKGTEFFSRKAKGLLKPLSDSKASILMENVCTLLEDSGYKRYEISNFCMRGKESRHNLGYWEEKDYLGVGAGAHSMITTGASGRLRWSNAALPDEYIRRCREQGQAVSWKDKLNVNELMFEFFFLGLRKVGGVHLSDFESRFGLPVQRAYPGIVEVLVENGFLKLDEDTLRLSSKGLMVADTVVQNFAPA